MADKIEFDIVANFNQQSLKEVSQFVAETKKELSGIENEINSSMSGLGDPARMLLEQLDRIRETADQIDRRTNIASENIKNGGYSADEQNVEARRIQNMLDDMQTLKGLMTGKGSFSVQIAKDMLAGLPQAIQSEFAAITPQLVSALRSGFSGLNKGADRITGKDISGIMWDAMELPEVRKLFANSKSSMQQRSAFVQSLIPSATSLQRTSEYQVARYGHELSQTRDYRGVEDILPQLYKGAYKNKGYVYAAPQNNGVLNSSATGAILNLIRSNGVAARAAEQTGLVNRAADGSLELTENVSRNKMLKFSEGLWNEFYKRTNGLYEKLDDYYGTQSDEATRRQIESKIVQRAQSGTSGLATAAMKVVSDLYRDENFINPTQATGVHRIIPAQDLQKRIKEQYVVEKIAPFNPNQKGSRNISLAESQITRLLGMQGHDYENLDAVKIVSLEGYDPKNKEHEETVRQLKEQGLTTNSGHYSVHAIHGTGGNTVLRMIRDKERAELTARYADLAASLGLKGTDILNTFIPADYEFGSPADLGKHMEQLNKMWTDAYEIGSGYKGKRFALVDFSQGKGKEFSDGLGFVGSGIINGPTQARFALSGKGSLMDLGFETIGEWAKANGKLDSEGRYMVRGANGEMFDASGFHGMFDISQIKNMKAFEGLNANQVNNAITGLIDAFGIGAVADYSYDEDASKLGSQMMTYLRFSPALHAHQAAALSKRLLELQTPEGKRKYVFNNPMSDPVSAEVNDPIHGDEYLATSEAARARVDTYIDSLLKGSGAEEFINYGDIANIQNERLLRSAITADFMTRGGMTDKEVAYFQDLFKQAHGRDFSADEVRKYMMLEGGVADFGHLHADKVAAMRSPTGFGQLIVRQNYAKMLKPVYDLMGQGTQAFGFQANNDDYKILAGADMDADMVKAIADIQNDAHISMVSELGSVQDMFNKLGFSEKELEVAMNALPTLSGGNTILNTENWVRMVQKAIEAPQKMGFFSNMGSRLAGNLDLFDETKRSAAILAAKANSGYDLATTLNKKPGDIITEHAYTQALQMGQEFSKIPAHIEDMYNVSEEIDDNGNKTYTTKDRKTVLDPSTIFRSSKGHLMNLGYLARADKTNLPSVQSMSAIGAMLEGKAVFEGGFVSSELATDLLEALGVETNNQTQGSALSFGSAGQASQRLMKNHRAMLAQFVGRQRFSIADEERDILAGQYAAAIEEIDNEFRDKRKGEGGVRVGDKWVTDINEYRDLRARELGFDQVRQILGTYKGVNGINVNTGMTHSNLRARVGNKLADVIIDTNTPSLPDMTPGQFSARYANYAAYKNEGDAQLHFVPSYVEPEAEVSEAVEKKASKNGRRRSKKIENAVKKQVGKRLGVGEPDSFFTQDLADMEAEAILNGIGPNFDIEGFRKVLEDGNEALIKKVLFGNNSTEAAKTIIADAKEFSSRMLAEQYSGREQTAAQKWYGINSSQLRKAKNALASYEEYGAITQNGNIDDLTLLAEDEIFRATGNFVEGRNVHAMNAVKQRLERLDKMIDGKGTEADQQVSSIQKWNDELSELKSERSNYITSLADVEDKVITGNHEKRSDVRIREFNEAIEQAQEKINKGVENLIRDNVQMFNDVAASLDETLEGKDRSPQAKIDKILADSKESITKTSEQLDDFYSKGLIEKYDYDKLKQGFDTRLKNIDNGVYRERLQKDLERQLGISSDTPQQRADKWRQDRLSLIDLNVQRTHDERLKGNATWSDYADAQRRRDYYEQTLNQTASRMAERETRTNQDAYNDFVSEISGKGISSTDRIDRSVLSMKDRVASRIEKMSLDDPMRSQWETLLNNSTFWDQYRSRLEDLDKRASDERQFQHGQRIDSISFQNQMAAYQRQRQYQQYNRNRYGQANRFLAYYQQNRDRYADFENVALVNEHNAKQAQERISNWQGALQIETDPTKIAVLKNSISETEASLKGYQQAAADARNEMQNFGSGADVMSAGLKTIDEGLNRVVSRLGRQIFQKALQEAKKFVQEFDASMNEIQAITLKSGGDMEGIRSQTINKAIGLRTSVSNVAGVEAALYRQGLSDAEVSERTDSIIKFATVTKLNVTDATKIITTALQNDLVPSAEAAMDALVALGDSAATTAAEIGKGMQKAAASAKVAGVSYAELTALLTIGTSDTQLSGTQVGTALQTVFSRMRKLSLNNYVADQNGKSTTSNDAEAALASVGIDLWDDKAQGKMKSAFEIMRSLSKVWQDLSDAQKSIVTNAMAGTRQTNIFSTLMEGMSEDNGANLEKYLGLATESGGITQSKYEIAMQSLSASMDELRSSWDKVVESFVSSGAITGVLDTVSGILQGIANVADNGGQIGIGLSAIAGGLAAVFASIKLFSSGTLPGFLINLLSVGAGLLVGGAGIGLTSGLTNLFNPETAQERAARESAQSIADISNTRNNLQASLASRRETISEAKEKYDAFKEAQKTGDSDKIASTRNAAVTALNAVAKAFPSVADQVTGVNSSLDGFTTALESATAAADNEAKSITQRTNNAVKSSLLAYAGSNYESGVDQFSSEKKFDDLGFYIRRAGADAVGRPAIFESYEDLQNGFVSLAPKDYPEKKAYALRSLLNNKDIKDDVLSFFNDDETVLGLLNKDWGTVKKDAGSVNALASAFDRIAQYATTTKFNQQAYDSMLQEYNKSFAEGIIKNSGWDFSGLATSDISADDARNMFASWVTSNIADYTNEDGTLDYNRVVQAVDDYIHQRGSSPKPETLKNDSNVKANDETPTLNTVGAVDSVIQTKQTNAGKRSDLTKMLEVASREDVTSMDALRAVYDKGENGYTSQVFADVLAGYDDLLAAYDLVNNGKIDFSTFRNAISKTIQGLDITDDLAGWVDDAIKSDSEFATKLRTDEIYAPLYKAFQSFYGDIADDIIDAAVDGTTDQDLLNQKSKVELQKRIKERSQYKEGYSTFSQYAIDMLQGTDNDRQAVSSSIESGASSLAEYNAAVNRYVRGTAKESDYAAIAQRSMYSETYLRNNAESTAARNSVDTERNLALAQDAEILQNTLAEIDAENRPKERQAFIDLLTRAGYAVDENGGVTLRREQEILNSSAVLNQMQNQLKESDLTSLYGRLNNFVENNRATIGSSNLSGWLGKEDANRLLTGDTRFANMLIAGANQADINAYIARRARGQSGTFEDNYGWVMNRLLGEDWQNIGSWNQANAQQNYASSLGTVFGGFVEEVLNAMPNGEEVRKYLSGEKTDLPEDYAKAFAEWMATETFSGDIDAAIKAANVGLLRSTNATDRASVVSDYYGQMTAVRLAQNGLTAGTEEGKGYISSLLGLDQTLVGEMMNTEAGTSLLQEMINEKTSDMLSDIGSTLEQAFDEVDFGGNYTYDSMIAELNRAAETADGEVKKTLQQFIDAFTAVKNATGNQSFKDVVESSLKGATDTTTAMNAVGTLLGSSNRDYAGLLQNNSVNWGSIDQGLLYMLNSRATGQTTFSDVDIDEAYNNALYGRKSSPENQQRILNSLFGGDLSSGNMVNTYQTWMKDQATYAGQISAFNSLDNVEELTEAMSSQEGAAEKTAKAVEDYNKQVGPRQASYLKKYGDYTDDAASSMTNLAKGGKTALKEFASLQSKMLSLQDVQTAGQKARGKSGKKLDSTTKGIIANYLGVDEKDVSKYTKEQLDDVLDSMEKAVNEEFSQSVFSPVIEDAIADINASLGKGEIDYEMDVKPIFNTDGTVDWAALVALLQRINSDAAATAESFTGKIVDYLVNIATTDLADGGKRVSVTSSTSGLKGGGRGGSYNKGGGGGGGKSAAQKLIDQWKNDLTPYTHEVTMTQKYESHYERTGDYQGYLGAINTEYAATMEYASKLQDAISSLQAKMSSVAEGSDDWYALRDAVYSYQEALEDTTEALNDLNQKQISALKTQHDNADIAFDHDEAILSTQLSRYQTLEDYDNVYSTMNAQLANYQGQYEQSIAQASDWAERMSEFANDPSEGVNSENYIDAWQNYNAEMEEAETHLNNIAELQQKIVNTKISEISTNLSRATEVPESEIGIRNTLSTMAQENGNYAEAISQQNTISGIYDQMIEKAEESRQANLNLMATLKAGTPEWYNARTAMLEATEQVKAYTEASYEADKAAKQLAVDAVSYAYEIKNAALENQNKGAELAQSIAEMNDDQPAIRTAIDQRASILAAEIENDEKAIADLKALLDPQNGSIRPDDANYKTYVEELYSREQALADKTLKARQLQQERQQSILNEVKTTTSDSATAYSHLSNMMSRRIQDLQSDKEYDKIADVYGKAAEDAENRYNELGSEIEALQEALGKATDPAVVRELQALLNQKTEEQADAANAWRTSKDNQQNALANRVMEEYKEVQKYDELYTQLMTDLATRYQQNGDRTGYVRSLEESVNHLKDEQSEDQAYLEELNATLASLDEDNQAYAGLENERINLIKTMSARQNNIEKQELQVQAARIDNVQREQNQDASLRAHNLSMVQYEQSRYQNLGELRNYGILIEKENELHRKNAAEIGNEIAVLTQLRDGYDENGNKLITNADYINQLTESIMKKEEAQKAENNAIEANIEKLRENQRAINQTRKALEDSVKAQIEAVEERNDNMLAGTVETEESIYEAIKKRYEDEWDLIKEDTQAKRDALNEEKEMLNERVNARKAARTAEDKQEQLAEYQRQAALLSLDPTRSKEVKEVQKKITDLQKELADLEYEKSIKSQTDVIEDQIEAMDKNEKYQEELRNEQLQDRNNFADEINRATDSLESYLKYFTEEEAEEFRNSTEAEREQMINQLIDRYYKAQGITDVDREGRSYQDTIRDILSTENEFISYMKENSQEYINGSDATRSILEYDWRKLWENNEDAEKTGAENFTFDDHEFFTMESSVSSINKTISDIKKLAEEFDLSTELNNLDLPSNATVAEIRKDIYAANDKTFSDYSGIVPKDKSNKTQEQVKKQADAIATDAATAKAETSTVPTTSDAGEEQSTAKNGWEQKDGDWYYYENDVPVTNAWKQIDGEWYRFDPDSKMQTGWYEDADHHWFYLDASGAMRKGWSQVGDQWYYHNDQGWMLTGNQTIAGKVEQFDEHGVWQGTAGSEGSSGNTAAVPEDTTADQGGYIVTWSKASNKYVIATSEGGTYTKAEAKVIAANKNKEKKEDKQPAGTPKAIDTSNNTVLTAYAGGGLVDFTGPAWVDGTKEKPEAFLNWTDTKNIRSLLDAINTISISPGVVPDSSYFDGNNTSVGDIVITINQAELKSDEDIEVLAKRVGRAFTRELTKDGLNLAGYAF